MVKVSFVEYINIYKTSFLISTLLSAIIILVNFSPSILYSICSCALFVALFIILLLNSRDRGEIAKVMQTLGLSKIYMIISKIQFIR